jgi:hypothetical protein
MDTKERQMVALGAKLIEQKSVQRTLGEARLEYATEISVLGSCAKNVEKAYANALKWCGMFAGTDEASEFVLNLDFELGRMTPEERKQLMAEWQGHGISWTEYRNALKRAGVASQDDQEAKDEIDSAAPTFAPSQATTSTTPPVAGATTTTEDPAQP